MLDSRENERWISEKIFCSRSADNRLERMNGFLSPIEKNIIGLGLYVACNIRAVLSGPIPFRLADI